MPKGIKEEDCDYNFENESKREESIHLLQKAYLELSKYAFLPFLYGFDLSSVINWEIYDEVVEHLKKVKNNLIETPSDISNIVKAVFDLAGTLNDSSVCKSIYIERKVDEYIMLSQAQSEEMIKK